MTDARRLPIACILALIMGSSNACATLRPVHLNETSVMLRTWKETKHREVSGLQSAIDARLDGMQLVLGAAQAAQCTEDTITFVETQQTDHYGVQWTPAALLLSGGIAGLGAGGYLTGSASGRPDIDDPYSRGALSRQGALGIGVPLAAAGAGLAAAGIYAIAAAQDVVAPPVIKQDVKRGTATSCRRSPLGGLPLRVEFFDKEVMPAVLRADGTHTLRVPANKAHLPPAGVPWARVTAAEKAPPVVISPPADYFLPSLEHEGTLEQLAQFQAQYYPTTTVPAALENRRLLLTRQRDAAAQQEAERLRAERTSWEREAQEGMEKSRELGQKHRWGAAESLLTNLRPAPAGESGQIERDLQNLRCFTHAMASADDRAKHGRKDAVDTTLFLTNICGGSTIEISDALSAPLKKIFHQAALPDPGKNPVLKIVPVRVNVMEIDGNGAITVDVPFVPGPHSGIPEAYCRGREGVSPEAFAVATKFCPDVWASYSYFAWRLFLDLQAQLRTRAERASLASFNLRTIAVRIYSDTGDLVTVIWQPEGHVDWFTRSPVGVSVRSNGGSQEVLGGLTTYGRYPAVDARGKPTGLGLFAKFAAGGW